MYYKERHYIGRLDYLTRYIQAWSITKGHIFESIEVELKEVYIL